MIKNCRRNMPCLNREQRPDQRLPDLCPSESVFDVSGRSFILHGQRSDERGVPGGKIPFYVAGCVVCIDLSSTDHFLSI